MKNLKSLWILMVTLVSVLWVDRVTKLWAVDSLQSAAPKDFGILKFIYAENPGAFLGLGSSLPYSTRFVLFSLLVAALMVGALWYVLKYEMPKLQLLGISLILSGGLGNLWDRLESKGVVVDFLLLQLGPVSTGIFNIADIAITFGVLVLFFCVPSKKN